MGKESQNHMNNVERQADMIANQQAFFREYPEQGTVSKTMKAIGLSRNTFYRWLEDDDFNASYQILKKERVDEIVTRLYQFIRGKEGVKLNQQQVLCAFFLLKAFDPNTFSEKMQLQHTGSEGSSAKVTTIEIERAHIPDSKKSLEPLEETDDNSISSDI